MRATLKRLLAHPRAPIAAALLAVLLTLPALGAGFFADDFTQQISFRPEFRALGGIRGDWDMFRFQGADRAYLRRIMDIGIWPWWTAPNLRLAFFRPLTSLWHAFDYRLLPGLPSVMHAENVALYGATVLLAARLYRRLLGATWVAGLAAVLYAVDDAHSLPVTWIAMRNASVSTLLGFGALLAHDRGRRDAHRLSAILAPLLFGLGLLGGEAALATLGYLVAHAVFVDEAPPRDRVAALAPYAAVTVAFIGVYKALGYGTVGSGMYVDPAQEPVAFLAAAVMRLPILLAAGLAGPPADLAMGLTDAGLRSLVAVLALGLSAGFVVMARALARDRRAAFFASGMVLSLVPSCGTLPNDRLLLFSGLGAFGLVARFLDHHDRADPGRPGGRRERVLAVVFVVAHAVAAPVLLPLRSIGVAIVYGGYIRRADETLPDVPADGTLVLLNAPDLLVPNYAQSARALRGVAPPARTRLLATALDANGGTIARTDPWTLEIVLRDGFAGDPISTLPRGASVAYFAGEVTEVAGMTAEVLDLTMDGRPARVRFRFDRPLEDPSLHFAEWQGVGFVPSAPPAVGRTRDLSGIDFVAAIVGR